MELERRPAGKDTSSRGMRAPLYPWLLISDFELVSYFQLGAASIHRRLLAPACRGGSCHWPVGEVKKQVSTLSDIHHLEPLLQLQRFLANSHPKLCEPGRLRACEQEASSAL